VKRHRLIALSLLWVLLAGCSHYSWHNASIAAQNVALAATVAGIAAATAAAQRNDDKAHNKPAKPEPVVHSDEPCNYFLVCQNGRCGYETNDGRTIACKLPDCSDGVPVELTAWCP
jgi:hypothetical protein